MRTVCVDIAVSAACLSTVHCVWQCCGGQTDRDGVVAERDATVAQLAGQLVRSLHVDVLLVGQECVVFFDAVTVGRRSAKECWFSAMPLWHSSQHGWCVPCMSVSL